MATSAENLERLMTFAELKKDWNSYGSRPIQPRAIELARRLAEVLLVEWTVVPMSDGGVQFETDDGVGTIVIDFLED